MALTARWIYGLAALAMLACAAPSSAQEALGQGRTPQQIFASDCALCHKSAQGLGKRGGMFGLQGFLREHYTASREVASVMTRYLEGLGEAPVAEPRRQNRRAAKPGEGKPTDAKPGEAKPADAKAEAKPETKPEAKPEPKAEAPAKPEKTE